MSFRRGAMQASPKPLLLQRSAVNGNGPRPTMMAFSSLPLHERRLHYYSWAKQRRINIASSGIDQYANRYENVVAGSFITARNNAPHGDLCMMYQINNLRQRQRHYSSGPPKFKKQQNNTEGSKTTSDALQSQPSASSATTSKRAPDTKNRRRKSSPNHSPLPLARIASNHPKNASPPHQRLPLTRKQILRLTPKQRKNLHNQRLREYEDSISYLDKARTNVRSNLKYLGETADGNFKKNINTLKRLFRGEEVWKDAEAESSSSSERESLARGVDWERAPAEIKANLRSNLSKLQDWLHGATDGMIPSSSYVGTNATGEQVRGGSVATRVQQFHQMKQNNTLVMDWRWKAKNIALALLPGAMLHVYFWSKQDEMKEYYGKLEQMEREKLLGLTGGNSGGMGNGVSPSDSGRMGISTALIPEGGSAWDRLKMTLNDLVFGGAEERISKQFEAHQSQDRRAGTLHESVAPVDSPSNHSIMISGTDGDAAADKNGPGNEEDATIQILLERVRALEKQLGTNGGSGTSKEKLSVQGEEQQQKELELEYKAKRIWQSPIQNRRDDSLAARWRGDEAKNDAEERKGDIAKEMGREDGANDSSYSLADVANFALVTLEPVAESAKVAAVQKMKKAMSAFGMSTEEEPFVSKHVAEEEDTPSPPAAETIRVAVDSTSSMVSFSKERNTRVSVTSESEVESVKLVEFDNAEINSTDRSSDPQHSGNEHGGLKVWAVNMWQKIRNLRKNSSRNGKNVDDQRDDKKEE